MFHTARTLVRRLPRRARLPSPPAAFPPPPPPPPTRMRKFASATAATAPSPDADADTHPFVRTARSPATGVATLTLDHPRKRNALSMKLLSALGDALDALVADPHTRAIIIRSSSPVVFCSGHDLGELVPSSQEDAPPSSSARAAHQHLFDLCSQVMLKVAECPQPVIAEVAGVATAAGCQLVASCDLAVCADVARFATPGVNIGLFCSTPAVPLARTIAPKHAMEMLLLGDMVDAKRAHAIGLVNRVVAPDALEDTVREMAEAIASKSSSAIRLGKQTFRRQVEMDLRSAYAIAGDTMVDNMGTLDAQEGIGAFLEKRAPKWSNEV